MTNHYCGYSAMTGCKCGDECMSKPIHVPHIKPSTGMLMKIMIASCLIMVLALAAMEGANRMHVQSLRNQEQMKW